MFSTPPTPLARTGHTPHTHRCAQPVARATAIVSGGDIPATSTLRLRFIAADNSPGQVVEAGIDAITLEAFDCVEPPSCTADTNGDGVLSPADFSALGRRVQRTGTECDQNADGSCTPADFSAGSQTTTPAATKAATGPSTPHEPGLPGSFLSCPHRHRSRDNTHPSNTRTEYNPVCLRRKQPADSRHGPAYPAGRTPPHRTHSPARHRPPLSLNASPFTSSVVTGSRQ